MINQAVNRLVFLIESIENAIHDILIKRCFMDIFYFSGTGNSLYVAKLIRDQFSGQLINMANGTSRSSSDMVGFVFPMYNHTVPTLVLDFIEGFDDLSGKYIFALCTYGHSIGITMKHLKKVIEKKGGKLALGKGVQMPYNYIEPESFKVKGLFDSFVLKEHLDEYCVEMNSLAKINTLKICKEISKRRSGIERSSVLIESLVDAFGLRDSMQKKSWAKVAGTWTDSDEGFRDMLKHMDDGFWSNESCVSCGVCVQVCPSNNISLMGGPIWSNNCEQCFACLHWCPEDAIEFRNCTSGRIRYKNIDIMLNEMIGDNNG